MAISADDDLATMYDEYEGKRCVMLWMKCEKNVVPKWQRSSVASIASDGKLSELRVVQDMLLI